MWHAKLAYVPQKTSFFKYRGTFIAYSNHMLYEINVDLGKRTSKNRLF